MSKYTIAAGNTTFELSESGGVCIEASASLDWAVSLPFAYVREYCKRKGWTIVPSMDETESHVLEFRGIKYTLRWSNGRLSSITKDDSINDEVEITWNELPNQLKGVI